MTDQSSDAETSVQQAVGTAFLQNRLVHQINPGQAPQSVLENASPGGEDCLSPRLAQASSKLAPVNTLHRQVNRY